MQRTGTMYYWLGNYPVALDYSQRALATFEELQDRDEMAGALINLGIIHRGKGDYAQTLACYQRSLKLLEAIGDLKEMARLYNAMAVVYSVQGDYVRALEGFHMSLKLSEALPQRSNGEIADKLHNIGTLHLIRAMPGWRCSFTSERWPCMRSRGGRGKWA